jgi:hypothetical protein
VILQPVASLDVRPAAACRSGRPAACQACYRGPALRSAPVWSSVQVLWWAWPSERAPPGVPWERQGPEQVLPSELACQAARQAEPPQGAALKASGSGAQRAVPEAAGLARAVVEPRPEAATAAWGRPAAVEAAWV